MGQRNSEWTGHGPVLEQDIAITNISLDFLGQARNWYQYAATLYNGFNEKEKDQVKQYIPRPWKSFNRELQEDDLAFLRDEHQYLNLLITELPKGDWAQTILRQFFFSAFQYLQYQSLAESSDEQFRAIAEKSVKEVTYHLRWSCEWVIRLGDGTEESHRRILQALNELWAYTGEMFTPSIFEKDAVNNQLGIDPATLKNGWMENFKRYLKKPVLKYRNNPGCRVEERKEGIPSTSVTY